MLLVIARLQYHPKEQQRRSKGKSITSLFPIMWPPIVNISSGKFCGASFGDLINARFLFFYQRIKSTLPFKRIFPFRPVPLIK